MMLSAVLLDTDENDKVFKAFITGNALSDLLPTKEADTYEYGGGHEE